VIEEASYPLFFASFSLISPTLPSDRQISLNGLWGGNSP